MKGTTLILLVVLALFGMHACSSYNGFVGGDEGVKKAWGNVQSAYQRRSDLIPNLVETVKGYADFEKETLTKVIEARSRATSITIDPSNVTPEQLKAFQEAQAGVSSTLGRLLAVAENYPDLKANQNFLELQSQLEGTENRIKVARDEFNGAVTSYNIGVRRFPANIYAGLFGFKAKEQFQADAGADKAPKVKF
jgi:LemA protein